MAFSVKKANLQSLFSTGDLSPEADPRWLSEQTDSQRLGICETTVNFHIRNSVEKLQEMTGPTPVTIGFRRGLLQLE